MDMHKDHQRHHDKVEQRVLRHRRLRRSFPGDDLILELLDKVDDLRERQNLYRMQLADLLATGCLGDDPDELPVDVVELQKGWRDFIGQGGATADDLRRFLAGEQIGSQMRVKRHLRIVASRCATIFAAAMATPPDL
jgi:hypothetical protein